MEDEIHEQETIIRPKSGLTHIDFSELHKCRHMIWSMVWKNIRVQFDDMYLGVFWATARPLTMLLVFALFKRFSKANMYVSITYSVYVYSGLILWYYFLEATNSTSRSVARDVVLIKKIYFPRIILPMVPVISGLYSLFIAMIPLIIMMIWYGIYPGWRLMLLPLVMLQCMILSMGVGTMFASFSIISRDADRFLGLILYVGLFVSPVIFAPDMIPHKAHFIFFLNPAAATLLAFRSCLFYDFPFPYAQWVISVVSSTGIFILGTIMYRHAETYFTDKL
jgi:lipopolysaccharide transport system permease protein